MIKEGVLTMAQNGPRFTAMAGVIGVDMLKDPMGPLDPKGSLIASSSSARTRQSWLDTYLTTRYCLAVLIAD